MARYARARRNSPLQSWYLLFAFLASTAINCACSSGSQRQALLRTARTPLHMGFIKIQQSCCLVRWARADTPAVCNKNAMAWREGDTRRIRGVKLSHHAVVAGTAIRTGL